MANLHRSTRQANTAREDCLCITTCDCPQNGRWHNHPDEVCPLHPDSLVDVG